MAFEKNFIISEEFTLTPKTIVFPFPNIFINFVKPVSAITTSLSFHELALINVSIVIKGSSFAMRLRCIPTTSILFYIVVFDGFIMIDTLS